jgi:hypothetical protein
MTLEKELSTYEQRLEDFLRDHEGQFVVIQGDQVAGFWDTYDEALKGGYARFNLTAFLVRKITRLPQVQFLGRNTASCRR